MNEHYLRGFTTFGTIAFPYHVCLNCLAHWNMFTDMARMVPLRFTLLHMC